MLERRDIEDGCEKEHAQPEEGADQEGKEEVCLVTCKGKDVTPEGHIKEFEWARHLVSPHLPVQERRRRLQGRV